MTTRRKLRKREVAKIKSNCFELDQYIMDNIATHLKVFISESTTGVTAGYPTIFSDHDTPSDLWKSVLEDMLYFVSNYRLYREGAPKNTDNYNEFVKTYNFKDTFIKSENNGYSIYEIVVPSNIPEFVYKEEAIDLYADLPRFKRGKKYLLKYFSALWL